MYQYYRYNFEELGGSILGTARVTKYYKTDNIPYNHFHAQLAVIDRLQSNSL